jgi:hypothetical protein
MMPAGSQSPHEMSMLYSNNAATMRELRRLMSIQYVADDCLRTSRNSLVISILGVGCAA